ncbi:hypothetical protein Noda2021_11110 [Candidatus Dependentiae bacterium Noda2021]|nr:hypothetical protein Noda2021_11110 [Candidatus Dependentiae bacterium Noda2021]
MIKKILLGLFLGVIATIVSLQYNESVQATISTEFKKAFEEALDCTVTFTLKRVNFFFPCLELEHVTVTPKSGNAWGWHTDSFSAGFSWPHLLLSKSIDLRVYIGTIQAQSLYTNKTLAIMPHIERMMKPTMGVPLALTELKLHKASFELKNENGSNHASIGWQSHSKKMPGIFKTIVHILHGTCVIDNALCLSDLQGNFHLQLTELANNELQPTAHFDTNIVLHPNNQPPILVKTRAMWDKTSGTVSIRSSDDSITLSNGRLEKIDENTIHSQATIALQLEPFCDLAAKMTGIALPAIKGSVTSTATGNALAPCSESHLHANVKNLSINDLSICDTCTITTDLKNNVWQVAGNFYQGSQVHVHTNAQYDGSTNTGSLNISNNKPLATSNFIIPQCHLHANYHKENETAYGTYSLYNLTSPSYSQKTTHGSYTLDGYNVTTQGNHAQNSYAASAQLQPFTINHIVYSNAVKPLFELKSNPKNRYHLKSMIDLSLIKDFIQLSTGFGVQADGKLLLDTRFEDSAIQGRCTLSQGNIRLPQTYNFINGLKVPFSIDLKNKKCIISNAECSMHKGLIQCKKGTLEFNNAGGCNFAHIPLLVDSCLLNPTKDLFAIVSGSCLGYYKAGCKPRIQGDLIIERAQLKENLFSPTFQHALFSNSTSTPPDLECDITLQTRDPIRIKTAFLEANAKVNLSLKNSVSNPELAGSIQIVSGALAFPYKPLYINKAEISLQADKLSDPTIEILAKNTIKKYQVSLSVTGSLQNHTVNLESSPSLTEDQIMALLLVGSPSESLNIVMPALVMQNIKNIVFESEQSPLKLDQYFRHMLKPLKHIHLVPSFIDQTGRGGLRGGIEIEIGERWRALIQKNFSLSEDTRFELEYLVSDDVSVRAIRDERRDASAEAEIRWKF